MSDAEFVGPLDASQKKLEHLEKEVQKLFIPSAPNKNLEQSVKQLKRANHLLKDITMANEARAAALARAEALRSPSRIDGDARFITIRGVRRSFALERHLALQSYVTTTWATYDMLWEVINELLWPNWSGTRAAALIKDGWASETGKKFPSSLPLIGLYGWSVTWSYAVRNHFVHEPYSVRNVSLFSSDETESGFDGEDLRKSCDEVANSKGMSFNLGWRTEPWPWDGSNDILYLLQLCNADADGFFSSLVASAALAVQSVVGHFQASKKMPKPKLGKEVPP